mmetsp:Transcript_27995/g.80322  ORF Transcript_27995/g.80322 Transcript_27995/m.80322 type:complete len:123 (+) Transcript_27995:130-498(+)
MSMVACLFSCSWLLFYTFVRTTELGLGLASSPRCCGRSVDCQACPGQAVIMMMPSLNMNVHMPRSLKCQKSGLDAAECVGGPRGPMREVSPEVEAWMICRECDNAPEQRSFCENYCQRWRLV